ncbi:winged helix-turn-helix domain-containing protein [Collinsella tanakaei]|uniref:winged helix-turn-helix domain-containing protein n=1 Tax=Collinsella tanakaei TaxID=626935 RepID=UPI002FD8375A
MLRCRGIELDSATHVASLHGERLSLTPKEFDLLAVLLRASGRPVATQDLYEAVWEDLYMPASFNSVMVHIRHLRSKLAALDSEQVFIETVWGVGYKIAP